MHVIRMWPEDRFTRFCGFTFFARHTDKTHSKLIAFLSQVYKILHVYNIAHNLYAHAYKMLLCELLIYNVAVVTCLWVFLLRCFLFLLSAP